MDINPIFGKLEKVTLPVELTGKVKRLLTNLIAIESYDVNTTIKDLDADNNGTGEVFKIKKLTENKIMIQPEKILHYNEMDKIIYPKLTFKDGIGFIANLSEAAPSFLTKVVLNVLYRSDDTPYKDKINIDCALGYGAAEEAGSAVYFADTHQNRRIVNYVGEPQEFEVDVQYPFDINIFANSVDLDLGFYEIKPGDTITISAYSFNMATVEYINDDGIKVSTTINLESL